MHEISLVRNIFRTLEQSIPAEEIPQISAINLRIGLLANVEPILLNNAFDAVTATDSPHFRTAKLQVELVPIKIHCDVCNTDSGVENYRFVCAQCGTPNNIIIEGLELLISGVEMREGV